MALRPNFFYESVFDIPYDKLYKNGKRFLIYDIDNTLAGYKDAAAPERIVEFVAKLQNMGFSVGLLSNNKFKRLESFNKTMRLPGKSMAGKPFTRGLKKLMRDMDANCANTVMIGDQLFADIWCGKNAGVATIMVKPITDHEILFVRFKRFFEKIWLKKYLLEK